MLPAETEANPEGWQKVAGGRSGKGGNDHRKACFMFAHPGGLPDASTATLLAISLARHGADTTPGSCSEDCRPDGPEWRTHPSCGGCGGHISEVRHPAGVPDHPTWSSGGRFPLALTTTGYPLPTLRVGRRREFQQKMAKLQGQTSGLPHAST